MIFVDRIGIFFAALWLCLSPKVVGSIDSPPDVLEDAELLMDQLIRKYNYPVEIHFVTTSDGYILRMYRMPNPGGKPILLQHGILDSSATYILMGPSISLGYYLFDLGYDVWLGNVRGNRYSRNHTTLNPDRNNSFWNFSWHEIGVFDIPAMIDYILLQTYSNKLYYVGHSQGTTIFLVMCSIRPEYNDKIIMAHLLAPVAFMKHIRTPLLPIGENTLQVPGVKSILLELLPNANLFKGTCLSAKNFEDICINVYFMIVGRDPMLFNRTRFPLVLGHLPAGTATKQVIHYLQLIRSDRFCQYDYEQNNKRIYGQSVPPDYDLKRITAPIALHYSLNDYLSEPVDVLRLSKVLPNVIDLHQMEIPLWNHMDFVWAYDVQKYLNPRIHELNRRFAFVK